MNHIKYCTGCKYQLAEDYSVKLEIRDIDVEVDKFIKLTTDGTLTVHAGYAWDGPSVVHDALYQLMREGELPESFREQADKILVNICKEDGMTALRAAYVYAAVREFASPAAKRQECRVITAP